MIDTRDYPSHDELKRAMRLEHCISELQAIDTQLTSLECAFNLCKCQYEAQVKTLESIKELLMKRIDTLEEIDIHSRSKKDENDE